MRPAGEIITRLEHREVVIIAEQPQLTVTWSRYGAGEEGPGLHVHREHTDAFYVLTGELTFGVGPDGATMAAGPGTYVAVPPGIAHSFTNASGADACWLNMHAPDAGFAAYLRSARDGAPVAWDSFDVPADGGLPPDGIVITPQRGA
jgi:quercetin dioxygenase-like cupin family protein